MSHTFDSILASSTQPTTPEIHQPLRICVEQALKRYFAQLEDHVSANLYELVLAEVEVPLLEAVLQQTCGNQTKAAKWLGLSRGTLRKKLQHYGLSLE